MRAKKTAIFLVLIAVSALTLFFVMLADADAFGTEDTSVRQMVANPDTLDFYRENVLIGPDGNVRVEVSVVLGRGGLGDLLLPFAFSDGHDFTILSGPVFFLTGPDGFQQPTTMVLGYRALNLGTLAEAMPGDEVVLAVEIPGWFDKDTSLEQYGEFSIRRDFVNSSVFFVREFELGLELSPGMRVHSVKKVQPAYDAKKEPVPPYTVGTIGERGTIVLRAHDLKPSSSVSLEIHARPQRRGPVPLIVGLVLAILYLVFFRDVLQAKKGS